MMEYSTSLPIPNEDYLKDLVKRKTQRNRRSWLHRKQYSGTTFKKLNYII